MSRETAESPYFLRIDTLERHVAALQSQVRHLENMRDCLNVANGDSADEVRRLTAMLCDKSAELQEKEETIWSLRGELVEANGFLQRFRAWVENCPDLG